MEGATSGIEEVVRHANRSELSRTTPISLSHISRVLGGNRMPSAGKLKILADAMHVPMAELYDYLAAHFVKPKVKRRRK